MGATTSSPFAHAIERAKVLVEQGQFAEAVRAFEGCLALKHNDADAMIGLGFAQFRSGAPDIAETTLRRCIAAHPGAIGAYLALGTLLGQSNRFTDAEAVLRKAVTRAPSNGTAWQLLGNALHRQGRWNDAEKSYRRALAITPNAASIWDQLGDVLIKRGDLADAEEALATAIKLDACAAAPVTSLGRLHEMRGDLDGAIALHSQALALDPRYLFAYINRGSVRRFKGDFAGALADCDAALALAPDMPEARGNRGYALLALGRLEEGWRDYAARIAGDPGAFTLPDVTEWDGQPLGGKHVAVWTEYGLGDELLAASLLGELTQIAAQCTLLCEPRLMTLLQRSFPTVTVAARGTVNPRADITFALADAARWLRPSFDDFPKHSGYITPDPARVADLRQRYGEDCNVGISWRSTSVSTGAFKSMRLEDWAPILQTPNIRFHSLQYGDCAEEIAHVRSSLGVDVAVNPTIDPRRDLDGFAAGVAAMDLVISISNTTVHFAGALGTPVWTLVPDGHGAHWYWFLDREDSPWYPSMRLVRQSRRGDWGDVIPRIAADLRMWRAS